MTKYRGKNSDHQVHIKRLVFGLFTLIFFSVIFSALLLWYGLWRPLPLPRGGIVLDVAPDTTYRTVIYQLAAQDRLHLPALVSAYARLRIHKQLQAGLYYIPKGSNARYMLYKLQAALSEKASVRLIEGWTYKQFKQYLLKQPGIKLSTINQDPAQIAKQINLPTTSLEGWLNPDTYIFPYGTSDLAVLKRFSRAQQKILETEWKTHDPTISLKTPYEALILASIIERETNVAAERSKIAGVFNNRLKQDMRLQTDPTVIYGIGDSYKGSLKHADLLKPTIYNTYTRSGLPPTPISMPSKASIHAATHPAHTDALYFVATGVGGHYFSKTLAEHNQAIARYIATMRIKNEAKLAGANKDISLSPAISTALQSAYIPSAHASKMGDLDIMPTLHLNSGLKQDPPTETDSAPTPTAITPESTAQQ